MIEILRRHAFSTTFVAILVIFVLLSGQDDGEILRLTGYTMGTTYDLQLVGVPEPQPLADISDSVDAMLARLDRQIFSTYAVDSELSRFNRHPVNEPFTVSSEMIDVLLMAEEVAELTDGAFDVTVGPLVNLWGFGPDNRQSPERIPDDAALAAASARVGHDYLTVDPVGSRIAKTRDIDVDLSAIAKGYAVDKLGDYFDSLGVEAYFLEIGGELKMKGLKPGGDSWIPAIEAPEASQSRIYEIFFSRGETLAVAGSGDYRNYFEENGVRYSHEIDPRTGQPIRHSLAAVYVLDDSAARADALATALMILGAEQGRELAEEEGFGAYFISKTDVGFSDFYTEQFDHYLSN